PRSCWRIQAGSHTRIAVAGFIVIVDGIGCPIIRGAGRLSIMGGGFGTTNWAGAGRPVGYGRLRGCAGATPATIAVGRHCRRVRALRSAWASHFVVAGQTPAAILVCAPNISALFPGGISPTDTSGILTWRGRRPAEFLRGRWSPVESPSGIIT